ncbi:MAG: caspase family protein [Leptolyngbyaceae cyanobacterium MO_188.B28]|nr:caspase family protein [Leptolyngbyaceae cyanobacterium MO_188.B28]
MSRDALIVGINRYQTLPALKAPARDAEAIANSLQVHGEFRVQRMPEVIQAGKPAIGARTAVTSQALEEALIRLFKPKGKNIPQTAVFYFSGHGIQREAGIREGYLATSDTDPSKGKFGVSLFWLRRLLQESPVRQRIVWLDCCHSGELLNFLEADPGAKDGTDRLFMAASREYESAYESLDSPKSVFTKALVSGLNPYKVEAGMVNSHAIMDWVSQQLKGEIQQPLFESSGSEIVLTRATGSFNFIPNKPTSTLDKLRQLSFAFCPYQGLSPFDEKHANYFFGREDLTQHLVEKIHTRQFSVLVGASSSGKTSLLRAGIIHQLRQGKMIAGSDRWRIKYLTPTEHPLKSLAASFIDPKAEGLQRAEQLRRAENFLQDGGRGLAQLVQASLRHTQPTAADASGNTSRLVLVVDHFEALFTHGVDATGEAERRQFIDCLTGALQEPGVNLSIVMALRADCIDQLSPYPKLAELVRRHSVQITPMSYEQLKTTITKPAEMMGMELDPNLLYSMLLDVAGTPGELPLIQHTLLELWRQREIDPVKGTPRLTLESYVELGGIRNVLNQQATDLIDSLSPEEQKAAQRIFVALCALGEGSQDSRRQARKSELINADFPAAIVEQTLEKLVAAKLVVINQAEDKLNQHNLNPNLNQPNSVGVALPSIAWPTQHRTAASLSAWFLQNPAASKTVSKSSSIYIDIVHESLIRSWPLLRQWIENQRHILRRQRCLEQAAQEWEQQGRPNHLEYLLGVSRLTEAEQFLTHHRAHLSTLAQRYITISRKQHRQNRLKQNAIRLLAPCALLAGMALAMTQEGVSVQVSAEAIPAPRTSLATPIPLPNQSQGRPISASLKRESAASNAVDSYRKAQSDSNSLSPENSLDIEISAKRDRPNPPIPPAQMEASAFAALPHASEPMTLDNVGNASHFPVEILAQSAAQALPKGCQTPMAMEPIGQWVSSTEPNKTIQVWMVRPQSSEGCVSSENLDRILGNQSKQIESF